MARYIDADKLLEILNEELLYESSMFSQEQEEYLRRGLRIAINDVKRFPAEDVVPKSEVKETVEKFMSATDKVICEAKQEVAREIFEEIEKLIYSKCFSVRADRDVTGLILDGELFAELKKKYMEGKNG